MSHCGNGVEGVAVASAASHLWANFVKTFETWQVSVKKDGRSANEQFLYRELQPHTAINTQMDSSVLEAMHRAFGL